VIRGLKYRYVRREGADERGRIQSKKTNFYLEGFETNGKDSLKMSINCERGVGSQLWSIIRIPKDVPAMK
jgi:hypothetical protein